MRAGHEVPLVLTQPDRPAGRGLKLQASPVKQLALEHGMPVAQPRSLRLDGKYPEDAAAARAGAGRPRADVMVVAAYGLILPQWVLDAAAPWLPQHPRLAAAALARRRADPPRHRGRRRRDRHHHHADGRRAGHRRHAAGRGACRSRPTTPPPRCTTAWPRWAGGSWCRRWRCCARARCSRVPQPAEGVTYAHKIDKAEAADRLAGQPAAVIERRLRAFDPFPGATAVLGGPAA